MELNSWELIFQQSKVNDGRYNGDRLPVQNWEWPRGTWFQERLSLLRTGIGRYSKELAEENMLQFH